jgi:hypothetical protein
VRHPLARLLPLLACVAVALALAVPTPALGQGQGQGPPTTETVITTHFTKSIALTDTPPCVGTVTYDVRDVFHITAFGGEVAHVTDTQTGTVTFVSAADGKHYYYSGRFSGTFNLQANRANAAFTEVSTYHLRVQAPDGARLRFWVTAHVTFAQHANEPTVEFFNVRCAAR